MRQLLLVLGAALALSGCATLTRADAALGGGAANVPTELPRDVVVDEQIGVTVEVAFQGASLAVRTAAPFLTPEQASQVRVYHRQAYEAVCLTRTAYDLANGRSPMLRQDTCPVATKQNRAVSYVEAGRAATATLKALIVATTAAFNSATGRIK